MLYKEYSKTLADKYGEKVYKLPVNLDVTCPNRDGTVGLGGCAYCGSCGAGYESLSNALSAKEQLKLNMEYIGPKGTELVNSFLNNITTILWSSGLNIVIYLSGLQSISPHIYEAARVDSASEWEIFWLITLPMMAPMIQLNLVFTVIYTFSMADNDMLEFIDFLAFNSTERAAYEYSSAVAWIYTLFILLIVGVIFLLTRRSVNNVKEGAA